MRKNAENAAGTLTISTFILLRRHEIPVFNVSLSFPLTRHSLELATGTVVGVNLGFENCPEPAWIFLVGEGGDRALTFEVVDCWNHSPGSAA